MENCLIKKLSSSVIDNTIAKVGCIVLEVVPVETPSAGNRALHVRTSEGGFTINVIGDGYMSDNYDTLETDRLTTYTTTDNTEKILYLSNSNFYIEITNKYRLRQITNYQYPVQSIIVDLARLKGCANLRQLSSVLGVVKGDISVFSDMTVLQYLILSGENAGVYGDIKSLAGKASLTRLILPKNVYGDIANLTSSTNLQYFSANNSKVTGDLSVFPNNKIRELNIQGSFIYGTLDELGKKITSQLTSLFLYDSTTDRYMNGITGTIEGFVASAVNNNITNGTITARGLFNGLTTFGGTAYPAQVYTTLVWAGTSKIYIQNSLSADKTIHCKGYSSSEIAEWHSQGYTVTDVTTGEVYPPTNS